MENNEEIQRGISAVQNGMYQEGIEILEGVLAKSSEFLIKNHPEIWAYIQVNLGVAFDFLSETEDKKINLEKAIKVYELALPIFEKGKRRASAGAHLSFFFAAASAHFICFCGSTASVARRLSRRS